MEGNSPAKVANSRVEVGKSGGISPDLGVFRVIAGPGSRQARIALASLALLLVACLSVDIYLLMGARLSAPRLVLVLVIQGALLMVAIALIGPGWRPESCIPCACCRTTSM